MNQSLSARPSLASLIGVFVFSCGLCLGPAGAAGQGLDDLFGHPGEDLFSQPGEAIFAELEKDAERSSPRVALRDRTENRSERFIDEPGSSHLSDAAVRSASDLRLVDSPGSRPGAHHPTAMELRQARALAESQARMARLEAARWGLRPTLRPTWVSDPMTASRFSNVQTYVVPVYVHSR